jgi:2-polyprenyl-3-methyl-5-hydroxy-6-metoxy-1,4-benzoquinol methylase
MLRIPRLRSSRQRPAQSHSIGDYQTLVRRKLKEMPNDRALALAQAIGAESMDSFASQGDGHVAVLRHHGLVDGMKIYDLGCGCGRTAQALVRSDWQGEYTGADVVQELLDELYFRCPEYSTVLNFTPNIIADNNELDIIFHWSVFTHLYPGEAYLYTADAFRALKPGGKMVFSFLEMSDPAHDVVWESNLTRLRRGVAAEQLDAFLHRDWICKFARDAGFAEPIFTNGSDDSHHPPFWQSLAVLEKPDS